MELTINEILQVLDGEIISSGTGGRIKGIKINSKEIKKNDFFFAFKGINTDGAKYLPEVKKRGGIGAIVENVYTQKGLNKFWIIKVKNITAALGLLARYYKMKFPVKTVGITGSNGKTTTKELTADILSTKYNVLRNTGNFNNEIGLPLTIFNLNKKIEVLVLEMGINHKGELSRLASIAEPDIGVITGTGYAHLEFLKSIRGVSRAKAELLSYLTNKAVLNNEDRFYKFYKRKSGDSISFGIINGDFSPEEVIISGFDDSIVKYRNMNIKFKSSAMCNVQNLMASIAVSSQFSKIKDRDIKKAVERFKPVSGRLKVFKKGKIRIIDDSYNANPTSIIEAAKNLSITPEKKIIVLGEMKELGRISKRMHYKTGLKLAELDIDAFYISGEDSFELHKSLLKRKKNSMYFSGIKELIKELFTELKNIKGPVTVLVKGSRKSRMEEVVNYLKRK